VPQESAPSEPQENEQHRPAAVLFVYSWDLVLAILALFGALAPFAGGLSIGQVSVNLPLGVQVLAAVASAAYAVTLIMVASMLTRRSSWIRSIQIATFCVAIALAAISIIVGYAAGIGVETPALLVTILFVLVDILAVVVMTERRVVDWYSAPGQAPRYLLGALGIWAAGSTVFVVLELVLRAGVK
jgi:hypothetical protein